MVCALGVEAISIDHSMLRRKPEYTRSGIAFLREWRGASNFDNRGARFKERIGDFRMLVQSGGDTNGIRELVPKNLTKAD